MIKETESGLRPEILEAARDILVSEGIGNLSMRKIAGEIGCKAPSIYYHFKNKDAIIHALIDEGHLNLYQKLARAYSSNETPEVNLENNLRAFINFGNENPQFYEIMYMSPLQDLERYPIENFRNTRKSLEFGIQIFKQCYDKGLIEKQDFQLLASSAFVMLHGYMSLALTYRLDNRAERAGLLENLIDGIFLRLGLERPIIVASAS